jgi:predicted esterase
MGEVYRARHVKLGREAAIKVLPSELASDPERLKRFEREARAASALNHPGIVTIYDIDEADGISYIAMELVDGETLRERLADGPLAPGEALRLAIAITEGLDRAHEAGIVHRDLKPDNVMITRDGHVKILDFGLAKQTPTKMEYETDLTTMSRTTQQGMVLGTVPYMSPEQAGGRPVDHLSDQFSFGVVLYEMLCGRRPFQGNSVGTVLSAILRDPPPLPRSLRPETPRAVEQVILRCLEKVPGDRYVTTGELKEALQHALDRLGGRGGLTVRWPLAAATLVVVVGAAGVGAWLGLRDDVVKWMERDTLAEITGLTEAGELYEAFRLIRGVQEKLPDDPEVAEMLDRITLPISIVTEPAGAEVRVKGYATGEDDPWVLLGETPLQGLRVPYALTRWQITREGFETFEGAPFGVRPFTAFALGFPLDAVGSRPEGMVRIPGGPFMRAGFPAVELTDYWVDRYETTNREFKEFLDAGGYEKAEYWTEPFVEGGREIPREEAMARLIDRVGRPGPAGWEFGSYSEGQGDYPVGGVSWYEAVAYCRSKGKRLLTLHHWSAATAQDQLSDVVVVSNFGGEGPAPVGSHPGLGDFGTYDMAGNVKEWCWNDAGGRRYILGGSWGEVTYTFRIDADSQPPFSRTANNGIRCGRYEDPIDQAWFQPLLPANNEISREPVSDEIFEAYRGIYAYDRTPLNAGSDAVDESSPQWRKETVSFDAAYGGERILAHLFIPRNARPPYQPVVWFPGNDVFFLPPGGALASPYLFDFIPRSGRVLVYPVYKGTYERHVPFSFGRNEWRDMIVLWSKDLSRTVDYLEEREDMDTRKLGYYGFSSGALYGPVFTAIDDRFKAAVLLAGGVFGDFAPEVDGLNFAPRSHVPTLMVNGRNDYLMPLSGQEAMFRALGAPERDKRHARLEGGHIPSDRVAIIEEVVGWFDRHLGPVTTAAPGSKSSED